MCIRDSARASRNTKDEVLKEVPTRMTEVALCAGEVFWLEGRLGLRVSGPVASRLLLSGSDIVAGCATRVDFKNRRTTPGYVI